MTEPALSAEEWAEWDRRNIFQLEDGQEIFAHIPGCEYRFDSGVVTDPGLYTRKLPAIAALCLYGTPEGFTREMVNALKRIVSNGTNYCNMIVVPTNDSYPEEWDDLAEQAVVNLENLLPPEE